MCLASCSQSYTSFLHVSYRSDGTDRVSGIPSITRKVPSQFLSHFETRFQVQNDQFQYQSHTSQKSNRTGLTWRSGRLSETPAEK